MTVSAVVLAVLVFRHTIFFPRLRLFRRVTPIINPHRLYRGWRHDSLALDDALEMFNRLIRSTPTAPIYAFNDLFTKIKKSSNYSTVISLYRLMVSEASVSPDSFTYAILVDCCRHVGRMDVGFGLLGHMIKRNCQPDVVILSSLINGLFDERRIDEAVKVFKQLPDWGCVLDEVAYCGVIAFCCDMDKMDFGLGLLGDMLKQDCTPNTIVCNALINGFAQQDEGFVDVLMLFARMPNMGCYPDSVTYNTVINSCCRMGKVEIGFGVLASMLKTGSPPSIITFTSLVSELCFTERIYDAVMLFIRVVNLEYKPDLLAYGALINGFCKVGDVDTAFALLGKMLKQGFCPSKVIICELINGMCMSGGISDATFLVEKMPELGYSCDVITYSTLIKGLCLVENTKMTIKFPNTMKMLTDHCKPDVITYNTIIGHMCKGGELNEALKLLDEMVESGIPPNAVTFRSFIFAYSSRGQWDDAFNILEGMVKLGISLDMIT